MHVHVPRLPTVWLKAPRCSARYGCAAFNLKRRHYATHRDALPSSSSVLSQTLDQKHKSARGRDTVGPFTLGLIQPSLGDEAPVKKWDELSRGEKVARTAARSTNYTVILFGAGLTAILAYALTSELFSRNSPTVLYGEACERIKTSSKVAQYLQSPLSFHNNPPSSTRPRHRNHHVSSHIAVDSSGREHLLLNFYVRGSAPGSSREDSKDDSYFDRIQSTLSTLPDITWEEVTSWTTAAYRNAADRMKSLFRYLSGEPSTPPTRVTMPDVHSGRETHIGRPSKEDEGSWWSLAGVFGGLRRKQTDKTQTAAVLGKFGEGEVHADLVKDEHGTFQWRYILIDFPNSRHRQPTRMYVEQRSDVRDAESVVRWN
ncbi:hypothetical protein BD410DRAFT_893722 [Rickenella mellea]|uniref:Mitochondrial import inner membrane translocase subunit Tim21 n=1 Tax=Rickenella mellea TaxID=50990 RepID=A0A4Y7QMB5_9AGAM|nr:hypothetical protein BD410DRAFT_893722 [Rickenella mellea]